MKVLVVTPTLGTSPWLAETVTSVATCAPEAEHVLVAPKAAVGALMAQFPGKRVIAEPGGGMYAAINAGLAASAEWEAFTYLNDDDVLLPGFAAVMRAVAVEGRGGARALVAYGGVRLIDAKGQRVGAIPISPAGELNRALYAVRLEPVYQHGALATRAVVDAIGAFDATLRFCGDSEFLARACVRGIEFRRATGREAAAFRLRRGQLTKDRAAMVAERAAVDERLRLLAGGTRATKAWARLRFRLGNLAIYAERVRRHGFVTFDELLERVE